MRAESRRWRIRPTTLLRQTPDTSLKAVFLEDAAALLGLLVAALGLALTEVTGDPVYDGAASVVIGVLLVAVAVILGQANVSLLVGRAVPERLRDRIRAEMELAEDIDAVGELLTLHLGPASVLVAARVDFRDGPPGRPSSGPGATSRTGCGSDSRPSGTSSSLHGPPDGD
ncbi:hypothetical protein GCM10029992_67270 [Glycomyces albus]